MRSTAPSAARHAQSVDRSGDRGAGGHRLGDRRARRQKLHPGDADQDLDFDQIDLVQVQVSAKYLSDRPATWGEGDWNGAPGGSPGSPPPGDGVFDQHDLVAVLQWNTYMAGTYGGCRIGKQQRSTISRPGR